MKKIDRSAHTGDGGIALIHQRVYAMGHVWHERKTDAGIDGEIEIRDPVTGEVANRLLLVQSKARDRDFPGENEDGFHYPVAQRDLDGWMAAANPVIVVCSYPRTGEAWWAHVQGQFADPAQRASRRMEFNKHTQRFDASAAARLRDLADPSGRAVVPAAEHRREVLTSNLQQVQAPTVIYSSPTDVRHPSAAYQAFRDAGEAARHDWVLRDGRLYTFTPPEENTLWSLATGTPDLIAAGEWLDAGDDGLSRRYVELLNRSLQQDMDADCAFHRGRDLLYFRPTPDLSDRKILGGSGVARGVFWARTSKTTGRVTYKHAALAWQFLHADEGWFCELTPEWHFTLDGYKDSRFIASQVSGLKRLDKNKAVHGQVLMWATFLRDLDRRDSPSLFDPDPDERDRILLFGDLLTFTGDRGIDDSVWLADPHAAKESDADIDSDTLTIFEAS